MGKRKSYWIKTYLFDLKIELICNHEKLFSILREYIYIPPSPAHKASQKLKLKINLVEKIDFASLGLTPGAKEIFDFSFTKYLSDKNRNYYSDLKTHIICSISSSEIKVLVCKKLLAQANFIKYGIVYPALAEILKVNGIFPLHAAALEKDKTGYLFPGPSTSGKTTISLALMKAGYKFLSDDMVFIKYNGDSLWAGIITNKDLNIRKKTVTILQMLFGSKAAQGPWKTNKNLITAEPSELCPRQRTGEIRLQKIVFPHISNRPKTKIARISQPMAFRLLMKNEIFTVCDSMAFIGRHIGCLKKISSLKDRYMLSLGRDIFSEPGIIAHSLGRLKEETL